MAIPAQPLGVVTLLILMTGEASLPFGYFPPVGKMTGRAFCRRVGGFNMELATGWVTGNTSRGGFATLFLQVALGAGKGHMGVCRTRMTGGAFPLQASSSPVTLIATELGMLSAKGPWMVEFLDHCDFRRAGDLGFLTNDRMAQLAILSNNFSFPAHMVPFVAAKATGV